jgi:HD-GYP domain-containing protein (c-di-GMP phosphodiesterase class II)
MGMSEAEIVHLRRGALLHDVGKISIPDSVLLKAGRLTDEEWDLIRRHPAAGYSMLEHIEYLRPALDVVLSHHERWDGGGYPRGLKGEAIPLAARIFALADVWDSLCADHPYRAAWPEEAIRTYIAQQAGTQFDPDIAAAFLEMMGS